MSDSVTIAEWEKNGRELIRVSFELYQGKRLISARVYYKDDSGEWRPGRQGLNLAVRHLPQLAEAFASALRQEHGDG